MKHRIFAAASALSLVVCLASLGMWARSSSVLDEWISDDSPTHAKVTTSSGGRIFFVRVRLDFDTRIHEMLRSSITEPAPTREEHAAYVLARKQVVDAEPVWIGVGKWWHEHSESKTGTSFTAEEWNVWWISYNFLALFAAVLPAAFAWRWWKDRTRRGDASTDPTVIRRANPE